MQGATNKPASIRVCGNISVGPIFLGFTLRWVGRGVLHLNPVWKHAPESGRGLCAALTAIQGAVQSRASSWGKYHAPPAEYVRRPRVSCIGGVQR